MARTGKVLRKIVLMARVIAVFSAAFCGACDEPAPIRIGFVGSFTGRAADLATGGRDGALLAVETANAAGGIRGRKIELLVEDDGNNPNMALAADKRLIDADVAAIIGHMTSQMSVAAVPLINRSKILMVSPTTSTNELSGIDDYFFRVYAANKVEASELGRVAREKMKLGRVAVALDNTNRAHSETWADSFNAGFSALGGQIVLRRPFEASDEGLLIAVAKDLLAEKPDGVAILAGSLDTGLLSQYLRRDGFNGQIFTSQWSITPDIFIQGGSTTDGIVFNNLYNQDNKTPRHLEFLRTFESRFRYQPGFAAAFGYESATVILGALRQTLHPDEMKAAVLKIRKFQGLQAEFEFDAYGDCQRQPFLKTIRGGRIVDAD